MPAITVQRNGHNGGAKRRLVRTREAIADTTTGLLRGERAGEGARAGSLGTRLPPRTSSAQPLGPPRLLELVEGRWLLRQGSVRHRRRDRAQHV
jgi:hypothetical protein